MEETISGWWKSQKRRWSKRTKKFTSSLGDLFELASSSPSHENPKDPDTSTSTKAPSGEHGSGERRQTATEPEEALKLNRGDVAAALTVYFPESAIVVLFRDDGSLCMSQNYAGNEVSKSLTELKSLADAVNVTDRNVAIKEGLTFGGKRFEVFQFHPPLVYGRTAGLKESVKDSLGIVVMKHKVERNHECVVTDVDSDQGGDGSLDRSKTAYLVVAYPLPNTSAYILSRCQAFCLKFL
jgi:hypothetical protein